MFGRVKRRLPTAILCAAAAFGAFSCGGATSSPAPGRGQPPQPSGRHTGAPLISVNSKQSCAYSSHSVKKLARFDKLVHRDTQCVIVFNNASKDWRNWENPWFLGHTNPDVNWANWATTPGTDRQLVITQNMIPTSLTKAGWRESGARGAFVPHAKRLAQNLVAAGLGDSVIRLGHEANGVWTNDNIGKTSRDFDAWRRYWRKIVVTMRSVPGAAFKFDWCVNAGVRPIPLKYFYPGSDVVDIVGIDAYDAGIKGVGAGGKRWRVIYNRPLGIRDVLRFARAHHKPLSFPEWGLAAPAESTLTAGDDPAYVNGIARVVRHRRVAYQAYFYAHQYAPGLAKSSKSLRAYRKRFGQAGDSAAPATR
jgi:Glycosyl hydrolase family 26